VPGIAGLERLVIVWFDGFCLAKTRGNPMGLDAVEIVISVEDEFQIVLTDAEAGSCETVGKLVDLVYSRLRHEASDPCPCQHGFYLVRRQLMTLFALPRERIRPETRLAELIGKAGRRQRWRQLIEALVGQPAVIPQLLRPGWLRLLVGAGMPLFAGWASMRFFWFSFFEAVAVAVMVFFLGEWLTQRFENEFPAHFYQVQDLVKLVRTTDAKPWTKEEVFAKIQAITVKILGVEASKVTLDAHFVNDLGVG
jgi:acyl carrier protein